MKLRFAKNQMFNKYISIQIHISYKNKISRIFFIWNWPKHVLIHIKKNVPIFKICNMFFGMLSLSIICFQ